MNRLAESTSLYLQQHADNPVDWHPWEAAALARARAERKPILLSIGYSACHWCHVMAHESFEDPATAARMNELFVNIKVDREERPDLDRIYQLSHQLLTGRGGGWPLTVFLDPEDLTPFFAGTYFPPQPRHGLPAFSDLLQKVRAWWESNPGDVAEQNRRLTEVIASLQQASGAGEPPGLGAFGKAGSALRGNFDALNGGFGGAPKFPQAPLLGLVQAITRQDPSGDPSGAGHMLRDTLTRMALSGLRDHLDGGFFRYCVDATWTIPHFEKMLYDNAMLLPLYAEASARWDDRFLAHTAEGIADWLTTAMRRENGGFCASIDADADGEEGGFHVWQRTEVERLLSRDEADRVIPMFGLDRAPNFEGHSWHLLRADRDPLAEPPRLALRKMLEARQARIPPATDEKQIASWNALAIEGLARAGVALDRPDWLDLAEQACDFVRQHLWQGDALRSVFAGGQARFPAYLDDHAGLLLASLTLLQARWRPDCLDFARCLADTLIEAFADPVAGGFYFTAAGAEAPVQRLRPLQDDALPGGNGVAIRGLLRLGHLTGETRYLDAARRALAAASREIEEYPLAHASLLLALDEYHRPATQVILAGSDAGCLEQFDAVVRRAARAGRRVLAYPVGDGAFPLTGASAAPQAGSPAQAFVCRGVQCLPPVDRPDDLARLLDEEG